MPLSADLPSWVFGYALLLGLVHAVVLYYLYRATRTTASADEAENESVPADRTVVCDNCGAENEHGYRYCRGCVEELQGGVGTASAGSSPTGRGMF